MHSALLKPFGSSSLGGAADESLKTPEGPEELIDFMALHWGNDHIRPSDEFTQNDFISTG